MYIKAFKSRKDKESYILKYEVSCISGEPDKYTIENENKKKVKIDEELIFNALDKLFKGVDKWNCVHETDGLIYTSNPPQVKCKKCGEFYR